MRTAATRRPVDGKRSTVGADHAQRVPENLLEILLTHREARHVDVGMIASQQLNEGGIRRLPDGLRPRAEALPFRIAIRRRRHAGDLHVVPAADQIHFGARLGFDARRDRRIVESREKRLRATVP